MRNVTMVVPVLITSCQVLEKPKNGPLAAQTTMLATASPNTQVRPAALDVALAMPAKRRLTERSDDGKAVPSPAKFKGGSRKGAAFASNLRRRQTVSTATMRWLRSTMMISSPTYEVHMAPVFRVYLDDHRRNLDDAHCGRHGRADGDREIDVGARCVAAGQHGFSDLGALLRRHRGLAALVTLRLSLVALLALPLLTLRRLALSLVARRVGGAAALLTLAGGLVVATGTIDSPRTWSSARPYVPSRRRTARPTSFIGCFQLVTRLNFIEMQIVTTCH
jgi:hypothetical protein